MTTHREFLIAFAAICVCAFPQQHGSAAEPTAIEADVVIYGGRVVKKLDRS